MDEYISKSYLITKFNELADKYAGNEHKRQRALAYVTAADMIKLMDAADVQPVKRGRWIEKPPYKDETVKGLEFQIVCSECDEQNCSLEFDENYNAIGKTFYRTRYCPNCGARIIKDGDAE